MKRNFLFTVFTLVTFLGVQAQVTQINSNKSLQFNFLLNNNKAIYISGTDQTLWVSDGTLTGTIQLSTDIIFEDNLGSITFLSGKLIFAGSTALTGTEIYITDGTPAGTTLLKDIYPGDQGSSPDIEIAVLNGFLYFTAERPAEGRELWRTDGTPAGTTLVKDIVTGPVGSNAPGSYHLFSTATYILLSVSTVASGVELWRSDGTGPGTVLLKDINTGNGGANSSNPRSFYNFNNLVLFAATDATHGDEIWKTDGTAIGTTMVADINLGPNSSTSLELFPGFSFPVFNSFHVFNNIAYFNAYNGTTAGALWRTDGTTANTSLLKDIVSGPAISSVLVGNAINLSNKFIFPVSDQANRSELWESDGTAVGTKLFKAFSPITPGSIPLIFTPFAVTNGTFGQALFQGNKFFFLAGTALEGTELWVSDGADGTIAHTQIVKDIYTGTPSGISLSNISWVYTSAALYFSANNGTNGLELWKTDGTSTGTSMVADIITGPTGSKIKVTFFLVNGKILFEADNGDSPKETDLYAVDGSFIPLPVSLADFTVVSKSGDAVLNWHTLQEQNSKSFTVQRSFDGRDFKSIGTVEASGASTTSKAYSFIDAGIIHSADNQVYYRLLCTDLDGKSVLSPVILLKLKGREKWNVRLMNNPIEENIKVVLSGITQTVQLSVIDMSGKKLYTRTLSAVNGQINLPLAKLPHGTYILMTATGDEIKTIQFVK
ncbi:MAG: T9SS type A sorting domain-containing protein [Ferruginibacter sp.]|nr:T9SS type A sorting domain-containing protein [Ferruginibacter sp.]